MEIKIFLYLFVCSFYKILDFVLGKKWVDEEIEKSWKFR